MSDTKRLVRTPIFQFSVNQVILWLKQEFARYSRQELTANIMGSLSNLRDFASKSRDEDGTRTDKLSYPYLIAVLGDISLDTDQGAMNKGWGRNRGFTFGKNVETGRASHFSLRPVKVGIGFMFNTDNMDDLLCFTHVLLMNAPRIAFKMEIDGFVIDVGLSIDPSVQIPEQNFDSPGVAYQYQAIVTLTTYIGFESEVGLIKELVFKVVDGNDPNTEEEFTFFKGPPVELINKNILYTDYFNTSKNPYGE